MNNYQETRRLDATKNFARKYGYYILLGVITLALVLTIALTNSATENEQPTNAEAIMFIDPVANATILKEYSEDQLLYNATLNQWEAHKSIDFVAAEGTDVLAVWDGVIESIYTNYMEGTVVIINHGEGLKSIYGSLDSTLNVEEGDEVEKGDTVGTSSTSANAETLDGAHLHFEVWEDGTAIDPSAYLASSDK